MRAATRDASFLGYPRHDGVGGHRPGAWGPKYHIKIDHPVKGASWSACGKAFLLEDDEPAEHIAPYQRCQLDGCRQRWT